MAYDGGAGVVQGHQGVSHALTAATSRHPFTTTDVYESAKEALDSPQSHDWEISNEVRLKIIETDTLISLVFYPDTPIGFYHVLHYDIDAALDEALKCLDDDGSVITP